MTNEALGYLVTLAIAIMIGIIAGIIAKRK